MCSDWPTVHFGEICERSAFGPRFSGDLYAPNGNVATLRTSDISEDGRIDYARMPLAVLDLSRMGQHILQPGDLVVTRTGRVGTAAVFDSYRLPVLPGAFLIRFRLRSDVADPIFYRYYFNSPMGHRLITSVATGSVQQNLNITSLHRLEIPLPPLSEQRAIVMTLGALDHKIELNRRMSKTLEATARAIFKSWFVDFDPVRGTASVPDHRGQFPERLVDSRIGPVPEGWTVAPLGEHVEVMRGLSYTSSGLAEKGMPLHSLNSVLEGGGYKYDGIKHYLGEYRERDRVEPGDVIVANTEQGFEYLLIGYPAIVPRSFGDDGLYSQDLCRLRSVDGSPLTPRYLYLALTSHRLHQEVAGYSNGTTVNHLAMDGLRRPLVVVPPTGPVARFDEIVVPMFDQQEVLVEESRALAATRDYLLPRLLSGLVQGRRRRRSLTAT